MYWIWVKKHTKTSNVISSFEGNAFNSRTNTIVDACEVYTKHNMNDHHQEYATKDESVGHYYNCDHWSSFRHVSFFVRSVRWSIEASFFFVKTRKSLTLSWNRWFSTLKNSWMNVVLILSDSDISHWTYQVHVIT